MCGRHRRCFMGTRPKALIFTGLMINIPATLFNTLIAPVSLWGENRYLLISLGVFLQIMCTVMMIYAGSVDPGIIPATFVSKEAINKVDRKYTCIHNKRQRVFYLV